jgi:Domain of unknown function (DUF4249)
LNSGQDSTVIRLSRTRNLDSASTVPELHAQVMVIGNDSDMHPLYEEGNGFYMSPQLGLNNNEKYQLRILTSNGQTFQSDTVSIRQTPAIDSVSWTEDTAGVNILVNTHDPQNSTWYYRWDYTETWQFSADLVSSFEWVNDQVVPRPPGDQIYNCWTTSNSTNINVATSSRLAKDVIYNYPLTNIPSGSERLNSGYSIIVRQYAITVDAYNYWQNLKQNTEQLGGLFDPQPSQIAGNIHNLSNAKEPVLGFISASSVSSQRIFISNHQLALEWGYVPYYLPFVQDSLCFETLWQLPQMQIAFDGPGPNFYTLYGTPDFGPGYFVVPAACADCRVHGGTNIKPAYWPF